MHQLNHPAAYRRGLLLVALSGALWGTVGIATQAVYLRSDIDAITVGFYRLAIAFPFVAALCWKRLGKGFFPRWKMVLIGVMLATYQVCYFAAVGIIGVAIATLVTLCTAPVIVALASAVFLHEPLGRHTLLALGLALVGTACLVGFPDEAAQQRHLLVGIPLCLASAAGYALVAMMGKSLAGSCHPLQSTAFSFGVGALCLGFLAAINGLGTSPFGVVWGLLLYIGLVPTAIAYSLFFLGVHTIKASSAAILTMIEPMTATLLAWLLFGERLSAFGILGSVLLLTAIGPLYLAEKVRR